MDADAVADSNAFDSGTSVAILQGHNKNADVAAYLRSIGAPE